ncbi:alpha/beta hydrolase [Mucilaginibacter ginkgonis]|nr:alpha/beta hydrolase-fold protein [Mucilaginibacter ginkgonis]
MTVTETSLIIDSEYLKRKVQVKLFLPEDADTPLVNLLLLNDGQETDTLDLRSILEHVQNSGRIQPVAVAAICAGKDRVQEYGVAGIPDFKGRGSRAADYTRFVIDELMPQLKLATVVLQFKHTAVCGFSLGALSALDIAWNNADVFDIVGVFSGSLWWRSKGLGEGYTNDHRIMHKVVRQGKDKPALRFFLQAGTQDETADRNRNGIIDSIDDTIDLIFELENKGYVRPRDMTYLEVVGGRHDMATWAAALPKFLCWAFGG